MICIEESSEEKWKRRTNIGMFEDEEVAVDRRKKM